MSANIFGGRFLSVRVPAWHNIGKVLADRPASVTEAFKLAGLDYKIHAQPIYAHIPTGGRPQSFQIAGQNILMREPTGDDKEWAPLGLVSDKYEILQNMDVARILDEIGIADKWKVETVGALGSGETIFVAFLDGEHDVLGIESEKLLLYFSLIESRDGKTAFKLVFTPVRIVCQNTLNLGLAQAITTVKVSHVKGMQAQVADRAKLMAGIDKSVKDTLGLFDKLAAYGITDKQALATIAASYPKPIKPKRLRDAEEIVAVDPGFASDTTSFAGLNLSVAWATDSLATVGQVWERDSARIETLRSQTFDLYKRFNDEQPAVARTGWAVVNAVVESEDFRDGPEGMFESTLWGNRAKTKARAMAHVLEGMK